MHTIMGDTFDRAPPPTGEAQRTRRAVILGGSNRDCDQLSGILSSNGYLGIGENDTAAMVGAPVAAFVSDEGDEALARCCRLAALCPVILVTDRSDFAFRVATMRAGVQAIVRRPINPTEIAECLSILAGHEATGFSVLIVDDDWLTAEVNAEILRSVGIKVTTVQDQSLALHSIENSPPDLVLMDVQMPGIDGVELTRLIRQSGQLMSLPVIFLSAERDEARQFAARTLGGDDFIRKPVEPEKLIRLVRLRAERSRMLRALMKRDQLTGLYGQTLFRERLSLEVDRCCRTGAELSVGLVEVDNLKGINDTHGRIMGDHVLRLLSGALLAGLRRIDMVGRFGSQEFGIVLLDTGPEDAARILNRIRAAFASMEFTADGQSFNVTFSAGVASRRRYRNHIGDLLSAAEAVLSQAKRNGSNTVLVAGQNHPRCLADDPRVEPSLEAFDATA